VAALSSKLFSCVSWSEERGLYLQERKLGRVEDLLSF
jgi:hypothetical protein